MNIASGLRLPLLVNGIYGIIVGLLLFFPSLGAAVFARPVKDAAVVSGWGVDIITVGLLAVVAASEVEKYGGLAYVKDLHLGFAASDCVRVTNPVRSARPPALANPPKPSRHR